MRDSLKSALEHHRLGRLAEAEAAYGLVLSADPENADALHLSGVLAHQSGRHDEALDLIGRAISLNPVVATYHNNLAEALRAVGDLEDALAAYGRAVRLRPSYADAYSNIGMTLVELGRPREALGAYHKALEVEPTHPKARWNLALGLLLLGQFERGWAEYESRWRCPDFPSPKRLLGKPTWNGNDPAGRTVLVHCEQGLGDSIQFVRYVPMLAERGARVVLECPRELKVLFSNLSGVSELVTRGEPLPRFDRHIPLLSLPRRFKTTPATVPAPVPYLAADAVGAAIWRERMRPYRGKFRVGLAWAGNPAHKNDRNRSCALADFAPLAAQHDIVFFSLQKGAAAEQAASAPADMTLVDFTHEFNDFAQTAAMMSRLDLIISVDTSVAHLAGAVGKPVWTLLPFAPDWRWMLDRRDSPWYPTMRLFRQSARGDWAGVMRRVAHKLAAVATLPRKHARAG